MNQDKRTRGLGRVFQRGPIWWVQFNVRGRTYRESSGSTNRADAVRLLKRKLAEAQSGQPLGPQVDKTSLGDLAQMLLDDLRANGRRMKVRAQDSGRTDAPRGSCIHPIEHVVRYFGRAERARDITSDRLTAYVAYRQGEGAANASVNRSLAGLRRAFNLALRAGRVATKPYFPMLREDNAREGFLEQPEFLALRDALPAELKDPATFLWLTGWRIGEARTLAWSSVYADAIRLRREHSKNRRGRELPLVGELAEVIARAREARRLDCPFVFHRDGRPIGDFRGAWAAACKEAGLGAVRVHDLRRSAARNLIRAGVPENIAMQFTGHKTSSIFRRYDIVTAADLAQASDRLAQHLARQPATPKVVLPLREAK